MFMIITISLFTVILYFVLNQPQFGASPSGSRLARIKKSPNYKNGRFQNRNHTPQLTKGYSYGKVLYDFFLRKIEDRRPRQQIPVIKTNLHNLPKEQDIFVWFGHSGYFIQLSGKRFLIDPVLSEYASPFRHLNRAFNGVSQFTVEDMPSIDYLLITHDHYDHLDYNTFIALKGKIGRIYTPLGVGAHLEKWGASSSAITEGDWWDNFELENNLKLHFTPARHFSGRSFRRNNTFWTSFVLMSETKKLFLGGDSGFDEHFVDIGKRFGPFDWAILENGQYNEAWRYIHSFPEEAIEIAKNLHAQNVIPVHFAKFDLGGHPWYEPLNRIVQAFVNSNIVLSTPRIGQPVNLNEASNEFEHWWKRLLV